MLDVDVGRAQLDGVGDDGVDELDDGGVDPQQRRLVLLLLLHFFEADGLIQLLDEAVDHRVGAQSLLYQLVELAGRTE